MFKMKQMLPPPAPTTVEQAVASLTTTVEHLRSISTRQQNAADDCRVEIEALTLEAQGHDAESSKAGRIAAKLTELLN